MKQTLPPPADFNRHNKEVKRGIPNPDHPLNRKNTYDPKDPDEICREALRVAYNQAHIRYLNKLWGEGWSLI